MATYVNKWGQTVTYTATNTGMLPTGAAGDYVIDADEQHVDGVHIDCNAALPGEAMQADGTTNVVDASGQASPFNPQYRGSSDSTYFPDAHT